MKSPVATARVAILIDAEPLAGSEAASLRAVRVHKAASLPAQCELTFVEPVGRVAEGVWPSHGAELEVSVPGQEPQLFRGQITAVEYAYNASGAAEVRVRAYDGLHPLRLRQPVRAYVQVTAAELARSLLIDQGIEVVDGATGPVWSQLVQHHQSDLDFLSDVAQRSGHYFRLNGQHLEFFTLEGTDPLIPLRLGASLLEAHLEANSVPCANVINAKGWDPWHAEERQGSVTYVRSGRRIPTELAAVNVGGCGEVDLTDETAQDDLQIEALAQAELDRRNADAVSFRGVAEGDPRLMPGVTVDVQGVAPAFSGQYVVTAATHTIDQVGGYLCEISTAAPRPATRPRGAAISIGKVTQVADPEGLGRVRAVLPGYGGVETDWLQVVMPGAGDGKGVVVLPDIGDRVLLAFMRGDPSQGVILGCLYGPHEPPGSPVVADAVKRYALATREGQRLCLDGEENTVLVDNGAHGTVRLAPGVLEVRHRSGSAVRLADKKMSIHAASDLEIEAPGRTITIRAKSVEFEQL